MLEVRPEARPGTWAEEAAVGPVVLVARTGLWFDEVTVEPVGIVEKTGPVFIELAMVAGEPLATVALWLAVLTV